jgi:5-methyltetrahydrofolate--homocysteine methyltransferase
MSRFLKALRPGRVLLMDGAMGTELQRAGVRRGDCGELWNVTHPERVRAVHQAYVGAGARVLLTNTFQIVVAAIACRAPLFAAPGRNDEKECLIALQAAACALARSACGPEGFVLADIGSYTAQSTGEEFSDFSMLRQAVRWVGPVDGILLETCSTPRVQWAVRQAARIAGDVPILLSMTYRRTAAGRIETPGGQPPEWFAERAGGWGVSALGVNCGRDLGMDEVIDVVRRYRSATDLPLFARPNAGSPSGSGKRRTYPHTPAQMAARLPDLLAAGATMVGGCCGTTPEHIAAFRPVVEAWNARQ